VGVAAAGVEGLGALSTSFSEPLQASRVAARTTEIPRP